jgi:hypothetical protein
VRRHKISYGIDLHVTSPVCEIADFEVLPKKNFFEPSHTVEINRIIRRTREARVERKISPR